MNELYAVLEWYAEEIGIGRVIARDVPMNDANLLVSLAPTHYAREVMPMSELKEYEA